MKTKDLATITTVALGTATLTVAIFLGNSIEADNDANLLSPTKEKPELLAKGVRMTLAPSEGLEFKAGDAPAFELTAVNTLDQPAELHVRLALLAAAPTSPFSRMLVIPAQLWCEGRSLALGPGETKTFAFAVHTNLPANKVFSVSMQSVDTGGGAAGANSALVSSTIVHPVVVGLRFSTAPKDVAPAANLAQGQAILLTTSPSL